MNKPQFVTFTGIDDKTDISRVKELSMQYPIEWGILFGGSLKSRQRYPDFDTIRHALETTPEVRFSAHLCGFYAKRALTYGIDAEAILPFDITKHEFSRIQINHKKYFMRSLLRFKDMVGKPIIMQARGKEFPPPLEPINESPLFPAVYRLHDLSGGNGKVPSHRPVQRAGMPIVGYAGGIGPHNVIEVLSEIEAYNFWIDMESNIRTDDWLDLDKCEAVCKAIWP